MDPTGPSDSSVQPTARRAGLAWAALATAIVAAAGSGWFGWQWWRASGAGAELDARQASALDELTARLAALEGETATLTRSARAIERRLADAESVDRSVREEVLGLGERARLVEDAVARLADRRLSGTVQLRLNEAEFLLRMGAERLKLFDDAAGAVQAFRLADDELAALDDPQFAGVRQAVSAEIAALAAVPAVDTAATLARLDQLADRMAALPTRADLARGASAIVPAEAGWTDRALAVLGQFVRIQRVEGSAEAALATLDAQSARAALAVEFAAAKAALIADQADAYRAAIERARALVGGAFAETDPEVQSTLATLAELGAAPVAPAWPEVGQALAQLRNLRATRALGDDFSAGDTP
jgi:uroporphyrin-3 C-methyltransferase